MLLLLLSQIIFAAVADPYHKYPYVFLLDVGNEEIEKTNREQIRVTVPGGSLALKYPAIDGVETITHVRVSGVDFGTDLKANIIEGGPGYRNVVLVFTGNKGVPYDAVVTIETVNVDNKDQNTGSNVNDIEESNDSSEDVDETQSTDSENVNEPSQSTYDNNDSGDGINNTNNDDQIESVAYENSNSIEDNKNADKEVNTKVHAKYDSFRPQFYGGAKVYPQAAVYAEDNVKPAFDPEDREEDVSADASVIIDPKYIDSNNNNVNSDYSYSADY